MNQSQNNPLQLFRKWFDEALRSGTPLPEAMTLATVTPDGKPAARMVLFKALNQGKSEREGFVFYTNYESRKGNELNANPDVALVFHWPTLEKQIRIEGRVEKVTHQESDDYWNSRPRESRLGGIASPQSREIESYESLEKNFAELAKKYSGDEVPRPAHWGGYRVIPEVIEFWEGRVGRLHRRTHFKFALDHWKKTLLAP